MPTNPPLVFLPGTLCDERLWMKLWQQMDIPERRYVPLQWAETREQMTGLTDYAIGGDKVHLIGFSMGGFIATQVALQQPQNIASLTLIGYNSAGLESAEIQQRHSIIQALDKGQFKPMSDTRLSQFVYSAGQHYSSAVQTVRAMEQDLGGSVLKYQLKATSSRSDFNAQLASAPFAVNIIAAAQDNIAPLSQLQAMHQQLPNSRLYVIEQCGHMLPLEAPEQLAQQLMML
ncbi:alpha/beta fold hydrolase [Neptunicella sp.]|uniref:alpha/beta fold hydrolase n=1 Tax=Neptunicella sp. TaxID=2125986 RepID=UPI003F68C1E6